MRSRLLKYALQLLDEPLARLAWKIRRNMGLVICDDSERCTLEFFVARPAPPAGRKVPFRHASLPDPQLIADQPGQAVIVEMFP
jgi:hypothetical protein